MNHLLKEIGALVKKEFTLEWRQRNAINGILLYVFSTVFVCYLSFNQQRIHLNPITWNTIFWIILLFSALNGISKSFQRETQGEFFFYYSLASPQAIILSKILYNSLLMLLTASLGLGIYLLVMGNPIQDFPLFLLNMILGAVSFSTSLTMISAISSKASNSSTMMAVLGFPIMLPMILMLIKVSKNAIDGLARNISYDEILTIFAINLIVLTVSYLLFPYLWRS